MNPTGGNGVYAYQWQRSEDFGSTWWSASTSKTYSAYAFNAASTNTHLMLRCTVSSGTETQVFNHAVDCTDCSFGFLALQTNAKIIDESSVEQESTKMVKLVRQRAASSDMYEEEVPIKLTVFPNPASYWLSIRLFTPRKEENLVLIVDAMGKIVARNIVGSEEDTINIGYLLPGIYLVVVSNSNGRWIEKLIVNK